jgi:hypothetical protein
MELSQEQGQLAELLLNLGAAAAESPEDSPQTLPEPDGEENLDLELQKALEPLLPEEIES